MRILALSTSLLLAFPLVAQDPTAESRAIALKSAFTQFQAEVGGQWIAQWHPATATPSAIYGTGLRLADWQRNSLEEARRHAERVLVDRRDLLGLGTSEFREIIGARMGRSWSFTFDQFWKGLPVIEGRADVRINMVGTIAMLGSRAFAIPADFDVTPAIDEQVASAIAWAKVESPRQAKPAKAPLLVIWGDIAAQELAPVFLAWEVAVDSLDQTGNGQLGRFYVDAKSGAVLHFQNDRHDCGFANCTPATHADNVAAAAAPAAHVAIEPDATAMAPVAPLALPVVTTVTVLGWTRTGLDAFSALTNAPLPGLVLNVPGIGTRTTDANGQFTIDITAPVTITVGQLDGRHFNPIVDLSLNAPSASVVVDPGVNATIQLLTAGATTNQAAHTTTAYWVDKTNEWARSILGNSSQMNTISSIEPEVNIASTCNAFYTGNTINFYNAGGCANTAFSTVIAHEWGHGLDDRYGGISNATGDGLSEAWGDLCGMLLVNSNLLGSGFSSPGSPLRNGINTLTYPQTGQGPHTAGQVYMGFGWEVRSRLIGALGQTSGINVSNDIVIGSIVADATNVVDATREVFIADDDDGNLLNGTPHYLQLSGAANAKLLPFPEQAWGTIVHVPLTTTTQRLTPRLVVAAVTPVSGSFTQVRLHYNAGSGNVVRNMQSQGLNLYRALLPGVQSGLVSYHFEAVHSTGNIVRQPSSGELTYVVDATAGQPFTGFYLETFETGAAGWTSALVLAQNDWQLGDPAGKGGTSGGIAWADPQTAAVGANCYANDLGNTIGTTTWNGAYAANVENWLRSPVLNCSGRTGVVLRFRRWLTIEDGQFDQATLLVNGVQVWQNPVGSNLVDTAWQTLEYALPQADNNPVVQIEWRLKSDSGIQLGGWTIDEVELGTRPTLPLGAELTMLPEQAVQGSTVVLTVKTQGPGLPYFLLFADGPGPITLPGFPTFAVGGNINLLTGTTDAAGLSTLTFPASPVSISAGFLLYSQVLTLDAGLTQWVVSNPFINLFTQFP